MLCLFAFHGVLGADRNNYRYRKGNEMSDQTSSFRLLHTMVRVLDLEKSIDFYTRHLGMTLLRKREFEAGRFTNAFLGYGDEATEAVIELTHNWDRTEPYEHGAGFGHFAIAVPDIYSACERMEAEGVSVPRPAGPLKGGLYDIAFVEDPDGYKIELVQRS
jgi:lactoylglutathione lyase